MRLRKVPKRKRIEAYKRFLRSHEQTGLNWLGPGECGEIAAIINAYLKRK